MNYDAADLRGIGLVIPVQDGGWWKVRWHVETTGEFDISTFEMPTPDPALALTQLLVGVYPETPQRLVVELLTLDRYDPSDIAFTSSILQRIVATSSAQVTIEGYVDHPILNICS